MRALKAEQPPAGCTAATNAAENRRRIVAAFARTPDDPAGAPVHRPDRRPHAYEVLWAADLVAYAYTAGGQLRRAIESLITVARVR